MDRSLYLEYMSCQDIRPVGPGLFDVTMIAESRFGLSILNASLASTLNKSKLGSPLKHSSHPCLILIS